MKAKKLWNSSHVRSILGVLLLFGCALLIGVGTTLRARAEDPSPRKLITRVTPKYPEYLRTHEIGGAVRLSVVVTPSGNVKSITPVGGNPILIDAATEAVKQWKYAPGDNTDTFEVKLDFIPRQ